jgi:hypothetical protein
VGALLARGNILYSFVFDGTVSNEQFVGPPAALDTITAGDTFVLSFDVDSVTDQVDNIDADFVSAGIDLPFPGVDTQLNWYTGSSPYEYRWDFNIPGMSPYTMLFWFRTTTPGVVNGIPQTLDASQFNYLHDFDIYENDGNGGPESINVSLQNATPEPATSGLVGLSLLSGVLLLRGSRRRKEPCSPAPNPPHTKRRPRHFLD